MCKGWLDLACSCRECANGPEQRLTQTVWPVLAYSIMLGAITKSSSVTACLA